MKTEKKSKKPVKAPASKAAKPSKPVAKKAVAKKAQAQKVVAQKAVAKKAAAKKSAPAKAPSKTKTAVKAKPATKTTKTTTTTKATTAKAPAKKLTAKKPVAKKAPVKKTVVKKAVVKKAAPKAPVKKTVAKKLVAKKAVVKKVVIKKTVAKAPAKKPVAPKAPAKKTPAHKTPAKKAPVKTSTKTTKAPLAVKTTPAAAPNKKSQPAAPVQAKSSASKALLKPVAAKPIPIVSAVGGRMAGSGKPSGKPIVPTTTFEKPNPETLMSAVRSTPVATVIPVAVKKNPKLANNWKSKKPEALSDEEVIAMPDSEYMNDVQLAFFRARLVALKNNILANADETTENLKEDSTIVPDPADRATIEEEHALELRTRDRERKLLKKIEQSIARIDANDYGYCDETGEPIGAARLLARPTATLSLEAQTRRELKQKMFGD